MLQYNLSSLTPRGLSEVEQWIRDHVAKRDGDYVVTVYETTKRSCVLARAVDRVILSVFGTGPVWAYTLVLKGNEWTSLQFCAEHALRTGLKEASARGALTSKAQQIWPGGSHDDVAMRTVAPYFVLQYLCYRAKFGMCCGMRYAPRLEPVRRPGSGQTGRASRSSDDQGQGLLSAPPPTSPLETTPPAPTVIATQPPPEHFFIGDSTPNEAQTCQPDTEPIPPVASVPVVDLRPVTDPDPHGTRICDTGSKYAAVVGQEDGMARLVDGQPDVVGALLLPISEAPNVPSNTIANVRQAITKRIDEKQLPCNLTKDEVHRIGLVVNAALAENGPFSRRRIRAWLANHFELADVKSKKWSEDRLRKAVDALYSTAEPRFSFAAAVKAEQMAEGKPPRMLIADADAGQVMALMTIACFESLMFEWYEQLSIKHASRRVAMKRVLSHLRQDSECSFIEGDGSAWDTTCGSRVRAITENPVLRRILEVAREQAVVPEQWLEAHDASTSKRHLKLKLTEKGSKTAFEVISAIRRSGHRGTSCLNWWINNVLWVCALCKNPEKSVIPTARNFQDFWGETITVHRAFEGDDSGLTISPPMVDENDPRFVYALEFWRRAGFNMKVFLRSRVGLFVGAEVALDEHGPTGDYAPEIPRTFTKAGVSCSSTTKQLVKTGSLGDVGLDNVRRSLALAKSYDFAGIVPSISRKYLSCSGGDCEMDHELRMRTGEGSVSDILSAIENANATVGPEDEDALLRKLGRSITQEERDIFEAHCWDWTGISTTSYGEFKLSLPAAWRG